MTLIVSPKVFGSKAKLKEALDAGNAYITDPSIFGVNHSTSSGMAPVGFKNVVTNHPLRTKFAKIEKLADGTWRVS